MKDIMKMALSLMIFATVACVGLAFVYDATSKTIAQRQKADLDAALKALFPKADTFDPLNGAITSANSAVSFSAEYAAKQNGAVIGVALNSSTAGFNDTLTALVGVGADGTIAGVHITQLTDTPGLGANASLPTYFVDKATKTTFFGQFAGKQTNSAALAKMKVQKDGGDVAAITAATITSRAVTLAVETACEAGAAWLDGGAQ